jgi:hypothetical protein
MKAQFRNVLTMLAALGALQGCTKKEPPRPVGVYAVPFDVARERVKEADLHGFTLARRCGLSVTLLRFDSGEGRIGWHVVNEVTTVFDIVVSFEALNPQTTKTAITISPDPKGGEAYDGKQFYPRPVLMQPVRPAVQELLDAAFEQRAFDVWHNGGLPRTDQVCSVQRGGAEAGVAKFHLDDKPGEYQSRRSSSNGDGFDYSDSKHYGD